MNSGAVYGKGRKGFGKKTVTSVLDKFSMLHGHSSSSTGAGKDSE